MTIRHSELSQIRTSVIYFQVHNKIKKQRRFPENPSALRRNILDLYFTHKLTIFNLIFNF
jgi:hypothetical protein